MHQIKVIRTCKALISRTLSEIVDQLIVPDDIRVPKYAFESISPSPFSEENDLLVVFEDGTIGSLGDTEKPHLRGGSSYERIYWDLDDILTEPEFEEGSAGSDKWLVRYYQLVAPITIISILTVLLPLYNDTLSFSSLDYGFAFFPVALGISLYPEIWLYLTMRKKAHSKIRLNLGEKDPIELISVGRILVASNASKTVGRWTKWAISMLVVTKFALPISTIEAILGYENLALEYLFACLFLGIFLAFFGWRELNQQASEGEVKVEHVSIRKAHDFIRRKWLSNSLEGLLKLKGESKNLEFKSSLWYDYDKANPNNKRYDEGYDHTNKKEWGNNNQMMSMNVVKAVAGFLNAGISGTLLIGVDDDCNILGLEKDFQLVDSNKDPEDDFTRKLEDILNKKMETEGTLHGKWNISWLGEEKRVCRLDTNSQVEAAVWTITDKGKVYYIRGSSATRKIDSGLELSKELKKFNK